MKTNKANQGLGGIIDEGLESTQVNAMHSVQTIVTNILCILQKEVFAKYFIYPH